LCAYFNGFKPKDNLNFDGDVTEIVGAKKKNAHTPEKKNKYCIVIPDGGVLKTRFVDNFF